jgi:DNA-binding PucR family transcriptional regulator
MLTVVSLASSQEALIHLARLDTISHLADRWSQELHQLDWSPALDPSCSTQLFAALRTTLRGLAHQAPRNYLAPPEFRRFLAEIGGAVWADALLAFKVRGVRLQDAASFCITLREVLFRSLVEAELLNLDTSRLLTLFFDWVLILVHETWETAGDLTVRKVPAGALELEDLRTIAESVRSPIDLQPVFQMIVNRVRDSGLWPMSAIGIIDRVTEEVRVVAQSGFAPDYPADIRFPAGGSATLAAVRRRRPIAIDDAFGDHEFPVLPDAARAAGYGSILLLPFFVDEMQAVVAFCRPDPHAHTPEEVALANAIAQQVAIAIENAHHYEQEKQRVGELESLNRLIAEQNRLLQRGAMTHTALIRLVLDGAGLERILKAIRSLVGNPVAIEDEDFQILIFSQDWDHFDRHRRDSIAAGGTAPALFSNPATAALLRQVGTRGRAALVPVLPAVGLEKRRIVAPIIASGDVLGYIWVMEALRPFDENQDLVTLEQAALVLALEMMKQRAAYETELRLRADFLDDLLSNHEAKGAELLQRASYLGYSFAQPSLLLIIDVQGDSPQPSGLRQRSQRTIRGTQEVVDRLVGESLVANQAGRVAVIFPAPGSPDRQKQLVAQVVDRIRAELGRLASDAQVCIGVSEQFDGISQVRHAYLQATRAIDAAKSLGRLDETVRLADLGVYGVLFRGEEAQELLAFAERTLAPLVAYDSERDTELVRTLDVFLRHQARLAETARELHIHVNTLRQRLERIEQVLGQSPADALTGLNLHLALRIREVAGREPEAG